MKTISKIIRYVIDGMQKKIMECNYREGWDYDLLKTNRIFYRILLVLTKSPCFQYSSGSWI